MEQIFIVTLATFDWSEGHSAPLTLIFIRVRNESWEDFMNRASRSIETTKLIQSHLREFRQRGMRVVISVQTVYDFSLLGSTLQIFIKKYLKKCRIRAIDNRMW